MVIHTLNYKTNDRARDMTKNKANKKHYPPAYYRYRRNHPTITLVLTRELKELLDSQKRDTDMSYSQPIKKFIGQAYDLVQARNEGYEEGYTKGLNKYRMVSLSKCSCGKPLDFHLDNPEELRILSQVISDSGIVHKGCQPKPIVVRVPPIGRCKQCGKSFFSHDEATAHCQEKRHTWEVIY
jgi:flagellar biosynthesis/type III secretory pathway protein FliH